MLFSFMSRECPKSSQFGHERSVPGTAFRQMLFVEQRKCFPQRREAKSAFEKFRSKRFGFVVEMSYICSGKQVVPGTCTYLERGFSCSLIWRKCDKRGAIVNKKGLEEKFYMTGLSCYLVSRKRESPSASRSYESMESEYHVQHNKD